MPGNLLSTTTTLIKALVILAVTGRAVLAAPYCQQQIVARYPHPDRAYTQGFLVHQGIVFESSGGYGNSWLGKYRLGQDQFLIKTSLNGQEFAEGLALQDDQLLQLTWKTGIAYRYGADTLTPLAHYSYQGEGWGLTYDGTHLLHSNGSSVITFRDPANFMPTGQLPLLDGKKPVTQINELEWVQGLLYANIWYQDWLGVFDPRNGRLLCKVDFSKTARQERANGGEVLNGIAYDQASGKLYITGKNWRMIYEVKIHSVSVDGQTATDRQPGT